MSQEHLGTRVQVPDDVLVQELPDEGLVFLKLETETYYGLDETGMAMWSALTETGSVAGALDQLHDAFDVDREVLRRDLDGLVQRLVERGLLRRGHDPA